MLDDNLNKGSVLILSVANGIQSVHIYLVLDIVQIYRGVMYGMISSISFVEVEN